MRTTSLTLAGLLLAAPAFAQAPAAPPPGRLDSLLSQWEEATKRIDSIIFKVERTEKDNVAGLTDVFDGQARFLKTAKGGVAAIYMTNRDRKDHEERIVITDTAVYHQDSRAKLMTTYVLPPRAAGNGVAEENVLGIMMGVKAADAKARYELKLVSEDEHYAYIEVLPKEEADKKEFSKAQLILAKKSMLPRRLFFRRANGNETNLELPQNWVGKDVTKLTPAEFVAPELPKGWKNERITQDDMKNQPPAKAAAAPGAPVIRPAGQ